MDDDSSRAAHTQTHTCTRTHSPCLPIARSLCLVSLPPLPLPLPHAHTDNGILYIVSLTQRRKHTHVRENSGKRTHIRAHARTHIHACSCSGLHDKYLSNPHTKIHTQFFLFFLTNTHTRTHTHKRSTTLSVLEFYILMKEEARCPIGAARARRDHLGADGGGVGGLA